MIQMRIPYSFIKKRTSLSWADVAAGMDRGIFDSTVPVQVASELLESGEQDSPEVARLAGMRADEPMRELIERLMQLEKSEAAMDKLVFLALAWAFERRGHLDDPLRTVEEIYADFDYPKEVAAFVRYMPMQGPDLGSREANERRLMHRWYQYVLDHEQRFRTDR
jgi:hypothetical protein